MFDNLKQKDIFWLAPIVVLVVAILPMPSGYYILSRIVVCGCSAYFTYQFFVVSNIPKTLIFAFFVILYNPIIPIYLYDKNIWIVINIITIVIFYLNKKSFEIFEMFKPYKGTANEAGPGKVYLPIEKIYEAVLPMLNIIKKYRTEGIPKDFWLDDYINMFFSSWIALFVKLLIDEGRATQEQRSDIVFEVWEKISPGDSERIIKKNNSLTHPNGKIASETNPLSEIATKASLNAADIWGILNGILKPELEKQPEVIRAKKLAKIMKSDLVITLGTDTENARTASALLYIHLYEYIDKKFGK